MLPLPRLHPKCRWHQTEIQRAVAEAELDLCTTASLKSGMTNAATESTDKRSKVLTEPTHDGIAAGVGVVHEAEAVSPEDRKDRRGCMALEPGEAFL